MKKQKQHLHKKSREKLVYLESEWRETNLNIKIRSLSYI